MKSIKIIIFIALLALPLSIFSQYSVALRLVNSGGDPLTGQASNISFTRYPHSYPTDVVSGITVTEVGTAGNYVAKGFTTFEYIKLWLSGVEQTWFDSVQVGNLKTWLGSNYISITTTQTGISGIKTLTGNWAWSAGTQTFYNPFISNSSNWISNYSLPASNSLVWKAYADSVYGIKHWFLDGNDIRLESGYEIHGRSANVSPIPLNTDHFTWLGDILNLNTAILNRDSIKHDNLTIGKDTTWQVLGEDVSKWRFFSLKKRYWQNVLNNYFDLYWYYKSFDESGTLTASDSAVVINNIFETDNETTVSLPFDGTYTKIDSLLLDRGTYNITFSMMFEGYNPNSALAVGIKDTVEIALKEGGTGTNTYLKRHIYNIHMYAADNSMRGDVLTWTAKVTTQTDKNYVYLYGRYLGTALSNAIFVGQTTSVTRGSIVATLVR